VVEAAVRCVRAVRPALGTALSPLLPPGISARFRLASDLAAACQELGFGGDVGYQTFLYSSEHDTRRLLLFLVEKLPRDEGERGAEPPGKSGALLRAIGARIQEQLGTPWVPPLCRTPRLQRLQVSWGGSWGASLFVWGAYFGVAIEIFGGPYTSDPSPFYSPPPPQEYLERKRLRARLRALEPLRQACPPLPQGPSGPPLDPAWLQEAFGAGGVGGALPKGSRFTRSQHLTHQQVWGGGVGGLGGLGGIFGGLGVVLVGLGQFCGVSPGVSAVRGGSFRGSHPSGGPCPRPQLVVESSSRRIVSLAGQWERHRGPLLAEFRQLRALRDSRESSRRLAETRALLQRSRAAAEEARRKETLHGQLLAELEALPRDVSRAVYTQRILEIVGNIRKQKEEIGKILEDTRALQKEINALVGKLERTFSVTDELLFKDAKRDEVVRKAYKYLAALHENCAQLIQTIEDTGTIQREIRDLEEQVGLGGLGGSVWGAWGGWGARAGWIEGVGGLSLGGLGGWGARSGGQGGFWGAWGDWGARFGGLEGLGGIGGLGEAWRAWGARAGWIEGLEGLGLGAWGAWGARAGGLGVVGGHSLGDRGIGGLGLGV
uniref:Coiled-coil domain-containing protein 22 n=1 Tax=Catharus ustulatus TaxID=91951 RepID=A0A8C3UTN0_CATUS